MDQTYAKSRIDGYRQSNRGLSPDRIEATQRTLGATQMNDSNDYGFDWLQNGYDWEATHRKEYSKSRRKPTDEWTDIGATMKDERGNNRRDGLGRTMKENLGATRRNDDLGATRRKDELGATRRNDDLGATRRNDDLGATRRNDEIGATRRNDELGATRQNDDVGISMRYGASQNHNLGATRRNGLGATRHVDLGATGDTRREAFGSSAVDKLRGSSYPTPTQENPPIPYYREIAASGKYGVSMVSKKPFNEGPPAPILEPDGFVVDANRYAIHDGQTLGPRRWTSLAADENLMEEWHNMFGQIRKKWTPAPSSRLDDDVTISKWSGDQSSSYSTRRRLNKRALIIIVSLVAVVLIVAAVVPTVILTQHKDEEGEVYLEYEYQATIKNRNYTSSMEDPNSEEFKDVENEFCSQLNENARDSGGANGFNYNGCTVTDIKSGSLIISYVIIIKTINKAPPATEVSAVINIHVDVDEQTVGAFVVINFSVVTETPKVITSDQIPDIIEKQFNQQCTGVKKERCVTKHSQCLDGMCKCPVGRTHNTTTDSCTSIDCGNEYAIANGKATSNGTQYNSFLNISCADGFELSTNETGILCTSPSSWTDLPICMPVECPEFIKPANSEIDSNSSGRIYRDVIKITCDTGYKVDGNLSSVECFANQSWSESPVCQILTCETFDTPDNASITPVSQQFDYNASVSVLCNIGFDIQGENNVTCLANGTWTDIPKCVPLECDHLALANATFEPTNQPYQYLDNVTVNCNDGYILEGINTVTCTTNGSWSELPTCIPIHCDPLEITYAIFEPDEQPYQYSNNINVDCNDGFTLEGNTTVNCKTNGTWSILPVCTPIDCDLLNITDAIFEPRMQPYTYLDNVTVDCADGYILEGSNTASCKANGTWSELPTCKQINCDPLEITNAFFSPNNSQFLYGENVTIGCGLGFQIQGANVLSCQTDGSWKEAPACDAIVCHRFDLSENVKIISEDKSIYSYNENVTLDCENGYVINGNATVQCQEDASWTELPTCRVINCSDFKLPSMAINNSKVNDLTFHDSVYITCESGFVLVGGSNISCKADGTWPTIACVEAYCSVEDFFPANNSRVSRTSESGTVFEFECVEGYNLEGNSSVSCIYGNWSRFPSCELVDCGSYGLIDNGNVSPGTGTKYDDSVDIACLENFKLIGESQGICLQNGSWTEKPVCMRLECQKFIVPENAIIPENINETTVGTNITLVCIGGYDLVGAEIVMCRGNETWSEIPDCKLKDCGPPKNINNSKLTGLDKTTFNSTFTVECEDGYDLKGESILQCQINGSWTKYPSCEIKDCDEIGELGNGTIVNQTGTLFGSTAYAICNDGYDLVGKENLTCEANGEWDMLPICIKSECRVYTPPDNAIFGSDYKISCKEGYKLIGEATIECLNGNWSGNGTCKRIQCKTLPQIDNADVEPDSGNYFGDTLNVSCKLGFELSKSLKAECDSNKTWINVPTCNRISCGNYSLPPNSEISEISTTTSGVYEDTINITCSSGFDIEGENYVICNATGEWENDPVCIPKTCGKFETPDHATFPDETNLDGFTYNQSITVTCDTGYNISGNSVVICGADAKWDSSPLCLPVNCPVLTLDDYTFIDRNETKFVYNDSMKISCDEGFNLAGNAQIFCTAQGKWTEIPSCNKINCQTFVIPENADIGEQSLINHSYNDIINVTCNDGYIITGNTQAICGSDGDWKNIPMCQLVNCSVLNAPENAIIEDQEQDDHNYKDIVQINCKEGYMLNGSNKVECLATGNWSELPTCIVKECDFIDSSDDGLILPAKNHFFSNENISVSCAVGYELQGSEIVACYVNGTLSDFPKCVPNDCEHLNIPANVANLLNETQFRYKDNVTIECNVGYELSRKDTLSCHPNGTWTDIPSCDPINCTSLDMPENAEASPNRTQYLFNDNITIGCNDGFELEGDTIIRCQPNGEWQGIPTCSPVECDPFEGPNIATIYPDKQNYTYNEIVTIECEAGYEIEGESTTQCQSNSSWSNIPTCRPITCDNLTLPENATTSSDVTVLKFDEEVSIICQSKLVMNISCFSNGTWPAIDCFSADCSIASVILPEHSKIKATDVPEGIYEIECIEGYKMIGNSSIQCLSGNWSDFPSCEIVECETSDLNSDTYTVDAESNSTIKYNSSVSITCLKGLALTDESDKDLTCGSDGKLYGNPECKIPGSVSFIQKPPEFVAGLNGTLICEVNDNPQWQTVLLAKTGQTGDMNSPIYMISNSTGSVINTTLDKNYTVGYKLEQDGVSISLEFLPVTCENEGNYICAVSVGDIQNATDTKFANTSLEASCSGCGKHEPLSNTYEVDDNESTGFNSTLTVTCIDGLELTDGSDKVVVCGSDGTWQGKPECKIPGSLIFTETSFATNEGEALNITCNVTDNPIWQRLLLGKSDGDNSGSYSQIFMLSNVSGSVEVMKINESYAVSHELHDTGVSITMTLDPVTCEDRGIYACVAMVGDPTNATDSKIASTQLDVSRDSLAPEITLPDRINVGEEAKVECVGQIGKDYSGEITGQLLLETNFGENGSNLTYNSTYNPEDVGCFYRDSISALIPTTSEADALWAQCVIQPKQGDAISSQKKNITINKSFVTFENSSYVFNIGENTSLSCIVQNIPEWNRIEIKRSDGKVILGVNSSDQQPDSYKSNMSLLSSESSFSEDSAKVTVRFDAVSCDDTLDGVGDVEYICSVETNNSTMADAATVTFQKKPGEPILKMSREIIENKFTLGDRMFSCEGDLGNPPGSIEVQSNYKGTFETFLSLKPGLDNNTVGWIVNNETDTSNCGNNKKINFAFHNISNDWQYKRLRCVIHPSDEIIGITEDLFEERSINIIPDDICIGKSGFFPHPYFCHLTVECSYSSDEILGIPMGCEENMCQTTTNVCVKCANIGGCNITNVKCDKTSAEAILGGTLTFTCDIQDFGEVKYISVNDLESVISDTDRSISVSTGVDATVTETDVILRFSNASCSQKGDYIIKLNNDTDVSLSLRVVSEPEKPVISMPGEMTANEATAINCSGKIGRDEQGNGKASIYLEVKFEDESEFTTYDADTTMDPEDKNCEILETVIFSVTPSVSWNNSFVRCTTKNNDSSISMHSSQEHVILQTPGLFCNPMLLGSQLDYSITFNCALNDVQQINSLSISKNETDFINIDNVTVPLEEDEEDVPFTVSIPSSLEQLTITFTDIMCEHEGDYSININNELSAILTLRVLAPTAMPSLTKPVTSRIYEKIEITCNGEVGRDIDGNAETQMFIEVQFEMETNFSIINTNVETDVPMLDNCIYSQEARLIFYPDISWNNSFVRCATWNESNIVKSSASEKIILYSPNTYFQDTNITGIIDDIVTLTCILKNKNNLTDIFIRKGEERALIASHKGGSNKDSVTVITNEIIMEESEGTLEINITLSCGDDGKYFCHQDSSGTPSEAVSVITTEWKAKKPILDPSSDMVENSDPWAGNGFETSCKGEMGTFQDSLIYLESNINGTFRTVVLDGSFTTVLPPTKDLEKCTNIATILFHNKYTSAWNNTILRCVVETDDEKLMDAEYVTVVPENFCDNIADNTIIDHPFDCRGLLFCGGARNITAYRPVDCGIEECYKPAADTNCIPCADIDKCRPDPLENGLFCNPKLFGSQHGESITFNCSLKDVQQINSLSISKNETDFISIDNGVTVPFEKGEEDVPFTVSIPSSLEQLTITFTDIKCEDEGDYSININNELSAILTLRVLAPTAMPSLTKPVIGRLNENIEITCNGEVGRDIDGNADTQMFIEVQFEMETNFSIINTNVETDVPMLDNCIYSQEARLIFYPDISWNNSLVRCASWNESNTVKLSASEKIILYSPNTYFQDTNITGIIGDTVTLTCILKKKNNLTDIFIRKGEERALIASHKGGSNKDSVTVITNEIITEESEGTLEINITLSCGDDGKYFCNQDSSDTPSEAVSVITTEWKAKKPILDPSSDMVENSEPWAGYGFETTCKGEMGTFQDSSIYLESNINGTFRTVVLDGSFTTVLPPTKDLEKCTNIATVLFHNKYTSAWNNTILRCVVETDDEKLMDAEYVTVVPENFCDNITDNTLIDHPFDCRSKLTCGGPRKILAQRPSYLCGIEECYKPVADTSCIPCADVDKCRPDPLENGLFCNPMLFGSQHGESITFNCSLKDVQQINSLSISKNETDFISIDNGVTVPFEKGEEDVPFTVSIPSSLEQLTITFTDIKCEDEGDYSININNELSAILTLRVLAPTAMPSLTKPVIGRLNENIEITCNGEVGRDIDGNADTQMFIEVQFEMETNFSIINTNVETDVPMLDNCIYSQEARLIFYPDISWNNSLVRCASWNESNTVKLSASEKIILYSPNTYFQDTNITGIIGDTVTLTCILKKKNNLTDIFIRKGEERALIASHKGGSNKDSVTVITNEIIMEESEGTLEINITLSCGDDGKYFCNQDSSDTPSKAVSVITTEWKAKKPILDPSSDMVENSEPWAGYGFETTCKGEMGTFQDSSIYLESNINGTFRTVVLDGSFTTVLPPTKDLEKCTNIATVLFHNKYTSAWNNTILRCVVETDDEKLMDAEYVTVVPENFCDNITDNTLIDHPFDCRSKLTCGGPRKILAQRPSYLCGIEECYKPVADTSCIPCADVDKCRLDPLDSGE